jgi:hypothetical protein
MIRISESTTGEFAIEVLEKSGYQYVYAPDSDTPERNRFEDVLLSERLQSVVGRITQNKAKTSDTKEDLGINSKQIHTLAHLRDTLLPKSMSGEARAQFVQGEAVT